MRNRIVGLIVIGIAALIGFIIFSFNNAMTDIISTSCSHGTSCPMWGSLEFQTNVSIGIAAFVALIGLYLTFFGEEERIVTRIKRIAQQVEPREPTKESYRKIMNDLDADEKAMLNVVIESHGTLFQSELMSKMGFSKVKTTRILDRLEGRNLVERKRRGMTNLVALKQ